MIPIPLFGNKPKAPRLPPPRHPPVPHFKILNPLLVPITRRLPSLQSSHRRGRLYLLPHRPTPHETYAHQQGHNLETNQFRVCTTRFLRSTLTRYLSQPSQPPDTDRARALLTESHGGVREARANVVICFEHLPMVHYPHLFP